jgi:hypothetical protein
VFRTEPGQHESLVHLRRLAAIEVHAVDVRMRAKERPEIIGERGCVHDGAVEAAGALGCRQDIPYGDAMSLENPYPARVERQSVDREEVTHDPPEGILRMRVVLPHLERAAPRQRSEDERVRVAPGDRRKTAIVSVAIAHRDHQRSFANSVHDVDRR